MGESHLWVKQKKKKIEVHDLVLRRPSIGKLCKEMTFWASGHEPDFLWLFWWDQTPLEICRKCNKSVCGIASFCHCYHKNQTMIWQGGNLGKIPLRLSIEQVCYNLSWEHLVSIPMCTSAVLLTNHNTVLSMEMYCVVCFGT